MTGCRLHVSIVRRWLSTAGLVWRRTAPTLHIRDPHKEEKMTAGADWQLLDQQKCVVTPGQNEKYYLAEALHSGTGKVSYTSGSE